MVAFGSPPCVKFVVWVWVVPPSVSLPVLSSEKMPLMRPAVTAVRPVWIEGLAASRNVEHQSAVQ